MKNIALILSLLLAGCVTNSPRHNEGVYVGWSDDSRDGIYVTAHGGDSTNRDLAEIVFTNFDGNLSFNISFRNFLTDSVMLFTGRDIMFLSPPEVDCYDIDGKLIEARTIGPLVYPSFTLDWAVLFLAPRDPHGKYRCLYPQIGTIHYTRQLTFASPASADLTDHSSGTNQQSNDAESEARYRALPDKTHRMEFRIPVHVGFLRLHSENHTYVPCGTNVTISVLAYRHQDSGQQTNAPYSSPAPQVQKR